MDEVMSWLLSGPSWVQYRTRLDLLGQPEAHPEVEAARESMLADPAVRRLVAEVGEWPGDTAKDKKAPRRLVHKLTFLTDLGLRAGDPGMDAIIARIVEHKSAEGPFQLVMNIPTYFGGHGVGEWTWALCDAPLIVNALVKCDLGEDPRVRRAIEHLVGLVRDNGWPCAVSPDLGKFRGPGRKEDPCPYANLVMLRALSQLPELRDSSASHAGAETLLTLWAESRKRHPYMFFMGTDFRKPKAPSVWYDILHVFDVLTRFPWVRDDSRLRDMAAVALAKADAQGRFTAESVWQDWSGWDFGQKRAPSRWVTLVALRALRRLGL